MSCAHGMAGAAGVTPVEEGRGAPSPKRPPKALPYWQIPGERPGNDIRRRWFSQERWEMERQRLRLAPGRPEPPYREPSSVAEIVHGIAGKLGMGDDIAFDALRERWPELVGADLARRCRPASLEGGTLAVAVKGAVWMFELRRAQARLLAAVRATPAGHDVMRLVFRPDAGGGER